MDLQFNAFLTRFWQQAQPPGAGAQKLGFLSNWDFATAAQGSDPRVPGLSCVTKGTRRAAMWHHGAVTSVPPGLTCIEPASTTQLPGSPGGTSLPNQAGGAFTSTFSVQIHYFGKHTVIFFTPNKYSLQYSKAKVIYEASWQRRCHIRWHHPRAPGWH